MVYKWEPGTQYDQGAVVEYQGHRYKIIQPHTSQGDWTPPATPALWARLPETAASGYQQPEHQVQQVQSNGEQKPWHEQHEQKVDIHHEEKKKHWYDLDDKRKKELEIGGGLAAGLALLGAGYYAYHEHGKNEEEKKAQVWGLQNWIHDAQARTEEFHQTGLKGPVTWILTNGTNIPQGALQGGEENGQPLFIARAYHEGGIRIGKAGAHLQQGGVICFKHKEIQVAAYEILISNFQAVRWVDSHGHLRPNDLGCTLVEGGRENDGSPVFVAQANHNGGVHPGKASAALDGAYIPYGGGEVCEKTYRVLAYA